MSSGVFKTTLILPSEASVEPFQTAVEAYALGTAAFEWEGGPRWSLEFYTDGPPDRSALDQPLARAAAEAGVAEPDPIVEPLPDIDWVAENQKSFEPIRAGRFYVHQQFHTQTIPAGSVALTVNAGTAFGTGSHATTWGCLMEIDRLCRGRRRFARALDLGCGTAILAMALAKGHLADCVVASDIDSAAVQVAQENARLNGVLPPRLVLRTAIGMRHLDIQRQAPYDLIVANILARPLMHLSKDVTQSLSAGGILILSGLLVEQEAMVLGTYRNQGLRLVRRRRRNGWSTLVISR